MEWNRILEQQTDHKHFNTRKEKKKEFAFIKSKNSKRTDRAKSVSSPLCCEAGRKLSTKSDFLFRLLVTIVAYLTPVSRSLFLAIRSLLVLSGNLREQFDSSLEMTCSCHIFSVNLSCFLRLKQSLLLPSRNTLVLEWNIVRPPWRWRSQKGCDVFPLTVNRATHNR